jgi:hypothetical protein
LITGDKTERQLFAAFAADAKLFSSDLGSMWPTLTTTAGTITSATTGQSPWITGAMALLTAGSTVSPKRINAVRDRLTRRHLWFVTELGGWCDSIHDATPDCSGCGAPRRERTSTTPSTSSSNGCGASVTPDASGSTRVVTNLSPQCTQQG